MTLVDNALGAICECVREGMLMVCLVWLPLQWAAMSATVLVGHIVCVFWLQAAGNSGTDSANPTNLVAQPGMMLGSGTDGHCNDPGETTAPNLPLLNVVVWLQK